MAMVCQFSFVTVSQEFWVQNEELVRMYEKRLGDAGYQTYKLPRTNNRGDGTLTNFVSSILPLVILLLVNYCYAFWSIFFVLGWVFLISLHTYIFGFC